jgi:hypothetical protein
VSGRRRKTHADHDPFLPLSTRLPSTCMAPLPLHRRTRRTDDLDTVPLHVGDERRYVGRSFGRWRQRQRPGGLAEPGVPEVLIGPPGVRVTSLRTTSVSTTHE